MRELKDRVSARKKKVPDFIEGRPLPNQSTR